MKRKVRHLGVVVLQGAVWSKELLFPFREIGESGLKYECVTEDRQKFSISITGVYLTNAFCSREGGKNAPLANFQTKSHENTKFGMRIDVQEFFF